MKTFNITEEQIKELAKGNAKVQRWFPEAFETKANFGEWRISKCKGYFFYYDKEQPYGLFLNEWESHWCITKKFANKCELATESEVFEALKKEAVKRGFVEGVNFNCPYTGETETLGSRLDYELTGTDQEKFGMCLRDNTGTVIYYKGIWSEIIKEKTLSKSEAEAKLNELINDGYAYKIG